MDALDTFDVLAFFAFVAKLKETARAGWNMKFPNGSPLCSRRVPNAESVGDHSYGLLMLAMVLAERLCVDRLKFMMMAALHDLAESVPPGDVVVWHEPVEDQPRLRAEKKAREDEAMKVICVTLGKGGAEYLALWKEYRAQETPEARLIKELDLLEVAHQAVRYFAQGHSLNPHEFLNNVRKGISHPVIRELFVRLEEDLRVREARKS